MYICISIRNSGWLTRFNFFQNLCTRRGRVTPLQLVHQMRDEDSSTSIMCEE